MAREQSRACLVCFTKGKFECINIYCAADTVFSCELKNEKKKRLCVGVFVVVASSVLTRKL